MTLENLCETAATLLQRTARPFATIIVSVAIAHAIERNPIFDVLSVGAFIVTGHIVSRGAEKIFGKQNGGEP